jgi:hypothetical protein
LQEEHAVIISRAREIKGGKAKFTNMHLKQLKAQLEVGTAGGWIAAACAAWMFVCAARQVVAAQLSCSRLRAFLSSYVLVQPSV